MQLLRAPLVLLLLASLLSSRAEAAPAIALGYTPKYAPGFTHFEYVNPQAPRGGSISISAPTRGVFDSFNPFVLKGTPANGLDELLFESLMEPSLDEPMSAYPALAEDAELAPDKLSVIFRLNPRARFNNGDPVSAADVKFSFETLLSKQAHPRWRIIYDDIAEAQVLDPQRIRFVFKRATPGLHLLAAGVPVFSRKWLDGKPLDKVALEKPITSGPYVIEDYRLGVNITYRRNPNYWGWDLPTRRGQYNFDQVTYKYYRDQTAQQEAFKAGEFEVFSEYSSKQWAKAYTGPKFRDGLILRSEFTHRNMQGMQAFIFNLRRPQFADVRVRRAIALALDFQWSNRNLFYGQYVRCGSYFNNSDLAATGIPQGAELALLEPYRAQLPAALFERPWLPPNTDPPSSLRANLREAKDLLAAAGYRYRDGAMRNSAGEELKFEVMLDQKNFDRIVEPLIRNLAKIGVSANYRVVDPALYKRREDRFDYDMVVTTFRSSEVPGAELRNMLHSTSAKQEGSRNLAGINNPVVDALVDRLINAAEDRQALLAAAHALDRVLLWNEYVIPNWYIAYHRTAYWNRFHRPEKTPLYYEPLFSSAWVIRTWWRK